MFRKWLAGQAFSLMLLAPLCGQIDCGTPPSDPTATSPAVCSDVFDTEFFRSCNRQLFENRCCTSDCCGPYVSVVGGWAGLDNFESTVVQGNTTFKQGASMLDGYAAGGSIGQIWHSRARSEFEFTFRNNSADTFYQQQFVAGNLTVNNTTPATGRLQSYSGMFNAFYDLTQRTINQPNLYGGGGIGVLYAEGDIVSDGTQYSVADSSFAYQLIGGVNLPISPKVDVFTEYRYLGADRLSVQNVTAGTSLGDFSFDSHNVLLGIRIRR